MILWLLSYEESGIYFVTNANGRFDSKYIFDVTIERFNLQNETNCSCEVKRLRWEDFRELMCKNYVTICSTDDCLVLKRI